MPGSDWERPDPAKFLRLRARRDWERLADRYRGLNDRPLERCLEVARLGGAKCAVIETRYIDPDYRSEYSGFHSRTFASVPDTAQRIHFFRLALDPANLWHLPPDPGYLGYMIVRPSTLGRVGRSMLKPPPGLESAIRTAVSEEVTFFGQKLNVSGVPFVQQDTQLGRCAHAAAWVCHYSAFRRGDVARRPIADFSLFADPSLGYGRQLPSEGLTVQQLLELLRYFDLPAAFYSVRQLPPGQLVPWAPPDPKPPKARRPDDPRLHPGRWDHRIIAICCRYLNSGYPVLIGTEDHAFVICGYRRVKRASQPDWIEFFRNDDQGGPYIQIGDVFSDTYTPWEYIIVPLPARLLLPPEPVERVGGLLMQRLASAASKFLPEAADLTTAISKGTLALKTYAVRANDFKAGLITRNLDSSLVREYRLARFSRYIWVVEAVDRDLRTAGSPAVIGEAIFDPTSSERDPNVLALHIPGLAWVHRVSGQHRFPIRCNPASYASGGVGPP